MVFLQEPVVGSAAQPQVHPDETLPGLFLQECAHPPINNSEDKSVLLKQFNSK